VHNSQRSLQEFSDIYVTGHKTLLPFKCLHWSEIASIYLQDSGCFLCIELGKAMSYIMVYVKSC